MSEELEKNLDHELELDEAKATGEDSSNMDPVAPAGGSPMKKNRKADLSKKVDPNADNIEDTVKTPQGSNDTGLKEAFDGLFEGQDLSEEFKTKTVAVFEATVHEKVLAEKAQLEEKFEADLQEQVSQVTEELVEQVDSYLDYVIEKWMDANEVAVESNIKVQVAESLLDSLKGLVVEHNLEVSEEENNLVAEAEEKLEEATNKYNEVVEDLVALREHNAELERKIAFNTIAEGLTDTQVDKLSVLAEGISFETTDDYSQKLSAIKESYFVESVAPIKDEVDMLQEEAQPEEEATNGQVDPAIAAYAESLGRLASK